MNSVLQNPDLEVSIWIAQPPEDIWKYVFDVSNDTEWRDAVISAKWVSSPPYGVGSTGLHIIEGVGDWPWKATACDEPHIMAWEVTGGRFEGSQGAYRIEPEGNGSRFTLETRIKRSIIMSLMMIIMKGGMKRRNALELEKLKAILEA